MNGVAVLPVIKLTNVSYGSGLGTVTPGRYAVLMVNSTSDNPSVPDINSIMFPYAYGSEAGVETDYAFGAEHMSEIGIIEDPWIHTSSQFVVVGEYNEPVAVNDAMEAVISMEAGFAEQYFE